MGQQIVVLAGGGHAHIEVIRRFSGQMPNKAAQKAIRLMLISPARHCVYSGMVPGVMAGHYEVKQALIDLSELCREHNARWVQGEVVQVDPATRQLVLKDGRRVRYDVVSLDVGSATNTQGLSGDTSKYAVKPLLSFLERWQGFVSGAGQGEGKKLLVAGGGVAGIELILAARHRLPFIEGYLVSRNGILGSHNPRVKRAVNSALNREGIRVMEQLDVVAVGKAEKYGGIVTHLSDSSTLTVDFLLLCTEARAHYWLESGGLPTAESGYIPVNSNLQIIGYPGHFAVGDTAAFNPPLAKAGVYPVRQAPVLSYNLFAYAEGRPLRHYRPQSHFLNLIATGDQRAIASRGWFYCRGHWVWKWKNRIDQKFVRQYKT